MADWGDPVAYMALAPGVPVLTADGTTQFAAVEHVLYVEAEDVFDGIVVKVGEEIRFVDRDQIEGIYQRAVVTTLSAEQASSLPAPDPGVPEYSADPSEGTGHSLRDWYRRSFGKLGWHEKHDR